MTLVFFLSGFCQTETHWSSLKWLSYLKPLSHWPKNQTQTRYQSTFGGSGKGSPSCAETRHTTRQATRVEICSDWLAVGKADLAWTSPLLPAARDDVDAPGINIVPFAAYITCSLPAGVTPCWLWSVGKGSNGRFESRQCQHLNVSGKGATVYHRVAEGKISTSL